MKKRYKVEVIQYKWSTYTNYLMRANMIAVDALINTYRSRLIIRVYEETFSEKAPELVYTRTITKICKKCII